VADPTDATDTTSALPDDLVVRLRRGDERALEQVFRADYAPLASFAFRYLRDGAAAEDVVQDTFAALWAARDRIVIGTSLRGYLYAVVRNRALNIRKLDAAESAREDDDTADDVRVLHAPGPRGEYAIDRVPGVRSLSDTFESLPERQAQVALLHWRDGLTHAEIADVLEITAKGVERNLSRALLALRRQPSNTVPDHPDPELARWLRDYRAPWEPVFDPDIAWLRLQSRYHTVYDAPAQRAGGTAGKAPASRGVGRFVGAVAALAAVVVIVTVAIIATRMHAARSAPVRVDLIQRDAAPGRPQIITLDDGSRITLNGGSTVRYPSSGSDRDVYLSGEALFEVVHDPQRAFRVHAAHGVVNDAGTTFTVRAYAAEHSVQVAVREGKVAFMRDSTPESRVLVEGGEAAALDTSGAMTKLPPSAVERLFDWTTGALILDGTRLSAAADEIEHYYGVHVDIADSALAARPVSGRFHGEPVRQVLDAIVRSLGAHYDGAGDTYTVRPGKK
jgi:RNA polymerase sigma factor (sigma-70 family)